MSFYGNNNPQTSTGELKTVNVKPVVQLNAQYGLLKNVLTVTDINSSGVTKVENSLFITETGTATDSISAILTKNQINIRAGQSGSVIIEAAFSLPMLDSIQQAGFINAEDSFTFAYLNNSFGVLHSYNGADELQDLVISNSGTGVATITINNIPYNVTLTSGTVDHNASEIAKQLKDQVKNFNISNNGNKVRIQSVISQVMTGFTFSGSTATANFIQLKAGKPTDFDFIPKESWNGLQAEWLDTTKLNIYKIIFDVNIKFYIQNPETLKFDLVHTITLLNNQDITKVGNPTFRAGWLVRNAGNSNNLILKGSKLGMFREGEAAINEFFRGVNSIANIGTTRTSLLTLRNRSDFNTRVNRSNFSPKVVSFSADTNKPVLFDIYINPTFVNDTIYEYITEDLSIIEYSKSNSEIIESEGSLIFSAISTAGASVLFDLSTLNIEFEPNTTIVITATVSSGANADVATTINWTEDI
jgi:hypothetical protein